MGISPSSQNMVLEVAIGRAWSDWVGSKPGRAKIVLVFSGQNWPGFFRAKNLTVQPVLKTGPVGPNSLFKTKKIRAARVGPGHTRLGHTGPDQIWPDFFRVNNLMAQPGPNFGWTGLVYRVGPILPLLHGTNHAQKPLTNCWFRMKNIKSKPFIGPSVIWHSTTN